MRSGFLLGFILGVSASTSPFASGANRPLSLKEAVRLALESSPAFDTAKKSQAISDLQYKSAFAKLLPSLDFSTTNGLQNNVAIASTTGTNAVYAPNSTAPWSSAISLGLTENLYDNGVTLTGLAVARLNRELAEISYRKNRASLTLDVATEFYHYSLLTVLLDVRKRQQEVLDKQFKTLTSQYEQGFKLRSDFLRIKGQVQRAEIDRVSAENDIAQSVANLRKLLGVDYRAPEPPEFEPLVANREAKLESQLPGRRPAFENVYDFRIAKIQGEVNDESVALVKRLYYPQLSLTAGATYSNQSYLNSDTAFAAGHELSWDVLVTLQFNLWDWGTRRRDVQVAEYNRDVQQNGLSGGLLDTNARITGLMADLDRIGRNYKLSRELLALEEESNRAVDAQYREGKVTYLDMITSLSTLLDAKIQFYTSYFAALTSAAQYQYYEGNIYEELVEK